MRAWGSEAISITIIVIIVRENGEFLRFLLPFVSLEEIIGNNRASSDNI